ncbi:TIGR00341 family protein [Oceanithermus sp.]|uniref:TIGR00341 family protein n=1 Tax=Oceanithermus sp. TaxID=2268145 RepID=UPI0025807587|nr:TIGR00341 family protein [Oceanithermus sp.]
MARHLLYVQTEASRMPSVLGVMEDQGVHPLVLRSSEDQLYLVVPVDTAEADQLLTLLKPVLGPEDWMALDTPAWTFPEPEAAEREEPTPAEELESDLDQAARLTPWFAFLTVASATIAFAGLVRDDPLLVLASMIIAPLMGPLMALGFGLLWRHRRLTLQAGLTAAAGAGLAWAAAWLLARAFAAVVPIEPGTQLVARSAPNLFDLALALVTGAVGAYSYIRGQGQTLVGVMVAIALLPPLVASGVFSAIGWAGPATGALYLALVNAAALLFTAAVGYAVRFRLTVRRLWPLALLLAVLALLLWWSQQAGFWTVHP